MFWVELFYYGVFVDSVVISKTIRFPDPSSFIEFQIAFVFFKFGDSFFLSRIDSVDV